jgi:hypothetical protein
MFRAMKLAALCGAASIAISGLARAADVPVKAPAPPAAEPPTFLVNNNSISYYYAPTATNPGAGQTPKNVVNFTHFDVWAYGTNFLSVDWLKASNGNTPPNGTPAGPCDTFAPGTPSYCSGYTEMYGLFRSTLGWNQLFNTKAFSVGPLTNISFAFGADVNADNTTLGSAKRKILAGLQFDFATPYKGFLNVGVFGFKEWQNDGFASTFPFQAIPNASGKVEFNTTWSVEINYVQPLGFLPASWPLTYKALAFINGDKGCGETCAPLGPGALRTNEYMVQQTLHLDVGKMVWNRADEFSVWAGFRWWKNKFGLDPNQPPGTFTNGTFTYTTENTWLIGATMALGPSAPPPAPAPGIVAKAPPAPAIFTLSNNSISYYYAPTATNPGAGQTPKNVVNFTHFDIWTYGTNLVSVDWLKATNGSAPPNGTPARPCDTFAPGTPSYCSGYTEIYGLYRGTLGWNQLFNTKAFTVGALTNISFAFGADANVDNTTLGSAKRKVLAGLQFDFATPYKGFLNVGVFGFKEWQNDGFAATFPFQPVPNASGKVEFDTTWSVEINYVQPLGFLPAWLPLTYKNLAFINGDKGCGETCAPLGPGALRTNEYMVQQTMHLDVGKMAWGKADQLSVWAGFRWWKNKFGLDPNQPPGTFTNGTFTYTTENTWLFGATTVF